MAAPEAEVITTMLAAADHRCAEEELAAWIRKNMVVKEDVVKPPKV